MRGNCYYELLRDAEAIACFNVCVALRPDYSNGWFDRGRAHLRAKNFQQAIEDFDQAIRLQPNRPGAYLNCAIAHKAIGEYPKAIANLTTALEIPGCPSRAYFERADVRRLAGDKAGAEADSARGLRELPNNEESWVARGFFKIATDPKMALADFDEALKINPRYFDALQNKAALLVDKFHQDAQALEVMNEAVRLYPDSVLTRGGRGVLLARIGKKDEALLDAQEALLLDSGAPTLYQVACIYSLLSAKEAIYQVKALSLLSEALRTGFALEWIDTDTDLDPIRKLPEYVKAVTAARALAAGAAQPQNR